jgi:hypothetical protein
MPALLARIVASMSLALASVAIASPAADAQNLLDSGELPAPSDSTTLRVFVDNCPCRMDYVRTEIPFVDYVRDRTEAEVHVLFTDQRTGGGGKSYTIEFIGRQRFAGRLDTMQLATPLDATDDEVRATLVRYLKLGLVPFLNETRAVNGLDVSYSVPEADAASTTPETDPWDHWVFRSRLNGSASSEATSRKLSSSASFTADRTTADWHIRFYGTSDYTERHFSFSDGSRLTSYTNGYEASSFVVKSKGPHWSIGGTASLRSSTSENQRNAARLAPALEYSLFPYRDFQHLQLTTTYTLGVTDVSYYDITVYDRKRETLLDHSLQVSYDITQPWGNFNLSVSGSQYLRNPSQYSVTASMDGEFRLFRGFSLDASADASRVNNQRYLPRGEATDEEVLLDLRQLRTSYRLSGRVGVSYTFGSIFNNIVNPRLGH